MFSRPLHFDVIAWKGHYPFFPYYLLLATEKVQAQEPGKETNKTSQDFSTGKNKPESGQESKRYLCPS